MVIHAAFQQDLDQEAVKCLNAGSANHSAVAFVFQKALGVSRDSVNSLESRGTTVSRAFGVPFWP